MRLDKTEAHRLLEHAAERNGGPWVRHSFYVAQAAEEIAIHCGMDGNRAYALGLLHDIGKCFGASKVRHGIMGYDLLCSFSLQNAADICISHCYTIKDINVYQGLEDYLPEEKERIQEFLNRYDYSDYDRLIQLADGLADSHGFCQLEERIRDILSRNTGGTDLFRRNLEMKKELLELFEKKGGFKIEKLTCISS